MMASSVQKNDFLSVVEEHLRREEIYRPPEEFVKLLALCPQCQGHNQRKILEEAILGMVWLVKRKLGVAGRRNTTIYKIG